MVDSRARFLFGPLFLLLYSLCLFCPRCARTRAVDTHHFPRRYLDGGAGCAHRDRTPAELEAMENAIANDDVIWHKTAVNFLPEVRLFACPLVLDTSDVRSCRTKFADNLLQTDIHHLAGPRSHKLGSLFNNVRRLERAIQQNMGPHWETHRHTRFRLLVALK